MDANLNVYLVGTTDSPGFRTTGGAVQAAFGGDRPSDADFSNYIFCIPPTYVHYRDVRIRGGYQGGYGGYLGSTWADGACLPLHWKATLHKDW